MPTQSSRSGSSRTKKTARSAPGRSAAEQPPAETPADTEVTGSSLERREIPSFSVSREARIAEAAYWRAERRGFAAGQELDDWLAAEREVDEDIENRRER